MSPRGDAGRDLSPIRLARWLPALLTLCVAALTLLGALAADRQAKRNAEARRATLSADIRAQALGTVDAAAQRTESLAASVGADWQAHRAAIFAAVARGVERESGINGIGLLEAVDASGRANLERRLGGIALYTPGGTLHRAPVKAEYYVVVDSTRSREGPSAHRAGPTAGARTRVATAAGRAGQVRAAARDAAGARLMSSERPGTVLAVLIYRPSSGSLHAHPRNARERCAGSPRSASATTCWDPPSGGRSRQEQPSRSRTARPAAGPGHPANSGSTPGSRWPGVSGRSPWASQLPISRWRRPSCCWGRC